MAPSQAVLAALALTLGACADYASERDLGRVDERVRDVAAAQISASSRIEGRIDAGFQRMDRLEQGQAESRVVLQQMGDGFNVLSDAAQEAHEAAVAVDHRQRRFEADVDRRFEEIAPPPLRPESPEAPTQLIGRGRDIRSGAPLDPVTLLLGGASMQLELPPLGGRTPPLLSVREVGDRLYAVGDDADLAWCLDIVERIGPFDFTAAKCAAPFEVYAFSVT